MARFVRATLVIYGGTSEIQRGIIAKTLGSSGPRAALHQGPGPVYPFE